MSGPDARGPGKWQPKPKGKCYYETGDEGDRCYVTQNGGPGGQKKNAPANKPGQKGWKDYEKQRWAGVSTMTLREKVIKLAHAVPDLRQHLVPLLKQSRRVDIKRMTPEEADAWMDAIQNHVGEQARQLEVHLKGVAFEAQRDLRALDRAWSKWDWKALFEMGLLSRDDMKFVQNFLGEYSR